MAAWYLAGSLVQLRGQINGMFPNRSKASDGSIGDAAHSARESDHTPTDTGQVCAIDVTHDPAGPDGWWLATTLAAKRDPRLKYVISRDQFWDPQNGWQPYPRVNPGRTNKHDHHTHVSVWAGRIGDDAAPWDLGVSAGEGDGWLMGAKEDLTAEIRAMREQVSNKIDNSNVEQRRQIDQINQRLAAIEKKVGA